MASFFVTPLVVAAGLLTAQAVSKKRRRREALRRVANDPALQAQLRHLRAAEEAAEVQMLMVHVDGGALLPRLAKTSLQVIVKVGEAHKSLRNVTGMARSGADGTVLFGDTFLVPWRPDLFSPVVRVRLSKVGVMDRILAKEEFWLPFDDGRPDQEVDKEIPLHPMSSKGEEELLGFLKVNVRLESFQVRELRRAGYYPRYDALLSGTPGRGSPGCTAGVPGLAPGGAPACPAGSLNGAGGGFCAGPDPEPVTGRVVRPGALVAGHVVGAGSASTDPGVVMGRPAQPSDLGKADSSEPCCEKSV